MPIKIKIKEVKNCSVKDPKQVNEIISKIAGVIDRLAAPAERALGSFFTKKGAAGGKGDTFTDRYGNRLRLSTMTPDDISKQVLSTLEHETIQDANVKNKISSAVQGILKKDSKAVKEEDYKALVNVLNSVLPDDPKVPDAKTKKIQQATELLKQYFSVKSTPVAAQAGAAPAVSTQSQTAQAKPPPPPAAAFERPLIATLDQKNIQDLVNFYSKRVPDIEPESVKSVITSLIANKRMLSESVNSNNNYGVPMQKAGVANFQIIKTLPSFSSLVNKISKETSVPNEQVIKLLEIIFKNEKLSLGNEENEYTDAEREKMIGSNIDENKKGEKNNLLLENDLKRFQKIAGIK